MAIDFFNNDPLRGNDNSGSEASDVKIKVDGNTESVNVFDLMDKDNDKPKLVKPREEKSKLKDEQKETKSKPKSEPEANISDKINEVVKEATEVPEVEAKQEPKEEKRKEKAIKKLMARIEEQELEVPAAAKFKHKVDGNEIEVDLQELLNNYSGKSAWDKKFSELDKERKSYQEDLNLVNKYIGEFAHKSKTNPVEALEFLAEQIGLDPYEYRKSLRMQFADKFKPYLDMSPEERELQNQREELEYLRQHREREANRVKEQRRQAELHQQFERVEKEHGISKERKNEIVEELTRSGYKDVTPDLLVQANELFTRQDRAFAALEKVDPQLLADEAKIKMMEGLLAGNPKLDDKELFNYANKLWGSDIRKGLADLEKHVPKKEEQLKKQHYKPKQGSPNRIDFFDDL